LGHLGVGVRKEFGTLPHVLLLGEGCDLREVERVAADEFVGGEYVLVLEHEVEGVEFVHVCDGLVPDHAPVPVRTAVAAEPVGVRGLGLGEGLLLLVVLFDPDFDLGVTRAAQVHRGHVFCIPHHNPHVECAWRNRVYVDQGLLHKHLLLVLGHRFNFPAFGVLQSFGFLFLQVELSFVS